MRKIAIFVEGQTELIFVRELLLKYFQWQNIWIECYNLFNDINLNPAEFSYKSQDDPTRYYQIINIGNDRKVISSILKREKYLFSENQKFDKIIGLRDMYSKEYREAVTGYLIDKDVCQNFVKGYKKTIEEKSSDPSKIFFVFAIMEVEAWLIAINDLFTKYNKIITNDLLIKHFGTEINKIDPETTFFHPAKNISSLLESVGDSYDKKKGEVNKFLSHIDQNDFLDLLLNDKCKSFNLFCEFAEIN